MFWAIASLCKIHYKGKYNLISCMPLAASPYVLLANVEMSSSNFLLQVPFLPYAAFIWIRKEGKQ